MLGSESSCKHTSKASTVTLKLHPPAGPRSGAVHVTVVVPTGKQKPDGGVQVGPPEQAVRTGGGKATTAQAPVVWAVMLAGQVITQVVPCNGVNAAIFGLRAAFFVAVAMGEVAELAVLLDEFQIKKSTATRKAPIATSKQSPPILFTRSRLTDISTFSVGWIFPWPTGGKAASRTGWGKPRRTFCNISSPVRQVK